jgi:thiosulfate/3-mercaptopyruvate sulfurtransferase
MSKGFTNPGLLTSAQELKEAVGDSNLRVVDTRSVYDYAAGHIPGAIHLDVYGISLNDTTHGPFEAFMWMFRYFLGSRGIGSGDKVVFYEEDSGMRAARGFWICEYLGHQNVSVLDGGLKAWIAAGNEVTTDCEEPEQSAITTEDVPLRHINADEILDSLEDDDFVALDVRSDDEYYARVARSARGGAIPRAVHVPYKKCLDEKGAYESADKVQEIYTLLGITPEKTVACY